MDVPCVPAAQALCVARRCWARKAFRGRREGLPQAARPASGTQAHVPSGLALLQRTAAAGRAGVEEVAAAGVGAVPVWGPVVVAAGGCRAAAVAPQSVASDSGRQQQRIVCRACWRGRGWGECGPRAGTHAATQG